MDAQPCILFCVFVFTARVDKEKLNDKLKEGNQLEEVDDSGFFAGKKHFFIVNCIKLSHDLIVSGLILYGSFHQQGVQSLRWV